MSNKKISQLIQSGNSFQDDDWIEGEKQSGGTSLKYSGEQLRAIEKSEREDADNRLKDAIGTDSSGDYRPPEGTNYLDLTTDVMSALEALDEVAGGGGGQSQGYEALNASDGDGGWNITDIRVSLDDTLFNAAVSTNKVRIGDEEVLVGGDDIQVVNAAGQAFEASQDAHPITKKYFDENSSQNIESVELTGDITGEANEGNGWTAGTTITDNAVTLQKIQEIKSETLLGNPNKTVGIPEEVGITSELRFTTSGDLGVNKKFSYLKSANTSQKIVNSTTSVDLIGADIGSENFFIDELSAGKTIRTTMRGTVLNEDPGSYEVTINVLFYPLISSEVGVASSTIRIDADADGFFELNLDLIIRAGGVSGTGFLIGNCLWSVPDLQTASATIKSTSEFTVDTTVSNRFMVRAATLVNPTGNNGITIESTTVEMI